MKRQISRRGFVKSSLLVTAAVPLGMGCQTQPVSQRVESVSQPPPHKTATPTSAPAAASSEKMPMGKMRDLEFSRLILGGNLIGGWSHSRDLSYVSALMRHYNTDAKIRETLEVAEANGINAINTWVMQENQVLFDHWKAGGKMKWFSQARLDPSGGFSQIQKAIDEGAVAVHLTGDTCDRLLNSGEFEKVGQSIEFMKSRKCIAGVAAHSLPVIVECEKAKLDVDFYQKTFHSHDYYTAPRPDEKDALGAHDNSWCNDPQAVIDVMAKATKPWIAFKILAAGAIPPRAAFPYAFNSGADFALVGMFDWQIEEDAKLARRVVAAVAAPGSKRTRPWYGSTPQPAAVSQI
jgi:hypothetical protein